MRVLRAELTRSLVLLNQQFLIPCLVAQSQTDLNQSFGIYGDKKLLSQRAVSNKLIEITQQAEIFQNFILN